MKEIKIIRVRRNGINTIMQITSTNTYGFWFKTTYVMGIVLDTDNTLVTRGDDYCFSFTSIVKGYAISRIQDYELLDEWKEYNWFDRLLGKDK